MNTSTDSEYGYNVQNLRIRAFKLQSSFVTNLSIKPDLKKLHSVAFIYMSLHRSRAERIPRRLLLQVLS